LGILYCWLRAEKKAAYLLGIITALTIFYWEYLIGWFFYFFFTVLFSLMQKNQKFMIEHLLNVAVIPTKEGTAGRSW
jgi:hypothetical protein